jgi:hypothetical protein
VSAFHISRRAFLGAFAGTVAGGLLCPSAYVSAADLTRGFEKRIRATASGEELNRQRNIWVLEVEFKPMRMIFLDSNDPSTGRSKKDQVWYLVYRAVNRALPNRKVDDEVVPRNDVEPRPGKDKFIPEFTLLTFDSPQREVPAEVYHDVIIPEAVRRVNVLERRRTDDPKFLDSVSVVQDLPDEVAADAENPQYIYGVAVWKNVNPDRDFTRVIMRGFSNGYESAEGPDGKPVTSRKVILQDFLRRGDRFDPNQAEFLFDGNPRWEYQPDAKSPVLPELESVTPAGEAAPAEGQAPPADM